MEICWRLEGDFISPLPRHVMYKRCNPKKFPFCSTNSGEVFQLLRFSFLPFQLVFVLDTFFILLSDCAIIWVLHVFRIFQICHLLHVLQGFEQADARLVFADAGGAEVYKLEQHCVTLLKTVKHCVTRKCTSTNKRVKGVPVYEVYLDQQLCSCVPV